MPNSTSQEYAAVIDPASEYLLQSFINPTVLKHVVGVQQRHRTARTPLHAKSSG
jgi:hypothetical protein